MSLLTKRTPISRTPSGLLLFESVSNEDIQMVPDLSEPISQTDALELEDQISARFNTTKYNTQQQQMSIPATESMNWNYEQFTDHSIGIKMQLFLPDKIEAPNRNLSEELNQFLATVGTTSRIAERIAPSSPVAAVPISIPVSEVHAHQTRQNRQARLITAKTTLTQSRRSSLSRKDKLSDSIKVKKDPAPGGASKSKGKVSKASVAIAKASTVTVAARSKLPVVAFDESGLLPTDHRPARGRGRHLQLAAMSQEQIDAEDRARQEKNRLAARDCRLRRKNHVQTLEAKVKDLQKKDQESQKIIAKLKAKLAKFAKFSV